MFIDVRQSTTGPIHDPYGVTVIHVANGEHAADFTSDGLRGESLNLYTVKDLDGKDEEVSLVRHVEVPFDFGDGTRARRQGLLKAELLFKRWVGITPDDAEEQYYADYEPDPMGPLSRYE